MLDLVLRRPRYRRLFLASTLSQVGDWLTLVAVSLLAEDGAGGPRSLGLMFAAHALPAALAAPFAGPIADRYDRRRVLVAAQVAQAAITAAMAIAAAFGQVALVGLAVLLRSATSALVIPAETAALRNLVEPGELVTANALVATGWSVAYVVGMAAGGFLAGLGPSVAIGLDALSFVVAGAMVATLPALPPPERATTRYSPFVALADMGAALREAARAPQIRGAILAKSPLALAGGAGWLALNVVAHDAHPFGSAAVTLGVLQAVRGVGTGVGPAVADRYVRAGGDPWRASNVSTFLALAAIVAFVLVGRPAVLLAIVLAWGAGIGANWVVATACLQRVAPDAMIDRLASLDELLVTGGMVAGVLASGCAVEAGLSLPVLALVAAASGVALWIARLAASRPMPAAATTAASVP